jgi:hypothetical protein
MVQQSVLDLLDYWQHICTYSRCVKLAAEVTTSVPECHVSGM